MIKSIIDKIKTVYDISLIPFEKLTLTSDRKLEEIQSSIGSRLEWTETFGMAFHKKSFRKYEGWIKNGEFKFRRILKSGRNSFIPIVSGKICQDSERVKIDTRIEFHKFVSIFLIGYISFALIMFALNISSRQSNDTIIETIPEIENVKELLGEEKYNEIFQQKEQSSNSGFSLLFVIVPYLISVIFFNIESRIVKNDLREMLQITDNYDAEDKE